MEKKAEMEEHIAKLQSVIGDVKKKREELWFVDTGILMGQENRDLRCVRVSR